jgi:hypothetical protein
LVAGGDTAGVTILCEAAKTEVMMSKYTAWLNYEAFLAGNIERYCTYHTPPAGRIVFASRRRSKPERGARVWTASSLRS